MRPIYFARSNAAPLFMAGCLLAIASAAGAASLRIGDPAPALAVGKWVKGEPVASLDPTKVYVVEFWATWCVPCRKSIPHLSELQAKHPDVVFIGQDIWERDLADARVGPFVDKMGERMSYRVATDDKSSNENGAMAATWMEAAGRNSIPTAFIIDKGVVAWIGHPPKLEAALDNVVAGTFDLAAAKKEAAEEEAKEAAAEVVNQDLSAKAGPFLEAKDYAGASGAIDEVIRMHPDAATELRNLKFGVLLQGKRYDEAYQVADQVADDAKDNAEVLNGLAWTIVDKKDIETRDYARAARYAARAVEVTEGKEPDLLDTLARVYADQGEVAKAIETQAKAVAAADDEQRPTLQKTLDAYRAKQAK